MVYNNTENFPIDSSLFETEKSGALQKHLQEAVAPIRRVADLTFKAIEDSFQKFDSSQICRSAAILFLKFVRGAVTLSVLVAAAAVHTVTHLTGLAQAALKLDKLASKFFAISPKPLLPVAILLRVITVVPAVFLNFGLFAKSFLYESGNRHWDFNNFNSKDNIDNRNADFNEWRQGLSDRISFEDFDIPIAPVQEGIKTPSLKGCFLQPNTGPVKGVIILQHGNNGCYQTHPEMTKAAEFLDRGYAVLLYNRRGCHESDGNPTAEDAVEDCINITFEAQRRAYLLSNESRLSDPKNKIILYGHSMGGLIAAKASEHEGMKEVRYVLDRTGINLFSLGKAWTYGITSLATELLSVLSGEKFQNERALDRLQAKENVIVIKGIKAQPKEGMLTDYHIEDEVFKGSELAMSSKYGNAVKEKVEQLKQDKLQLIEKEARVKQIIDNFDTIENLDQEKLGKFKNFFDKKFDQENIVRLIKGYNKQHPAHHIDSNRVYFSKLESNELFLRFQIKYFIKSLSFNNLSPEEVDLVRLVNPDLADVVEECINLRGRLKMVANLDKRLLFNITYNEDSHNAALTNDIFDQLDQMLTSPLA